MDQLVSDGDKAETVGDHSGRCKATSRRFLAPFAHLWKIENGSIVAFQERADTALLHRALRDPDL